MPLTKRTHSNPCFWTALWNEDYYERFIKEEHPLPRARDQVVFSLNVKADKIIVTNVNNVHFDNQLGISEITQADLISYAKRNYSGNELNKFLKSIEADTRTVILDFENVWTAMEDFMGYKALMKVARNQNISSKEEKLELVFFTIVQNMRSPSMVQSMIDAMAMTGDKKFAFYILVKQLLSDISFLERIVAPYINWEWTLYVSEEHVLPLPDCPVLINEHSTMVAISPRLLLEINKTRTADETFWRTKQGIPPTKLSEYRNRCIGNSFKEIIFCRQDLLEEWRRHPHFRTRVRLISENKPLNRVVYSDDRGELLKINAIANTRPRRARARKRE